MKMSGQLHAPAAVTADKTPMRVKQEVCGAPKPAWTFCGQKKSCLDGDSNTRSSIPWPSYYTNSAIQLNIKHEH